MKRIEVMNENKEGGRNICQCRWLPKHPCRRLFFFFTKLVHTSTHSHERTEGIVQCIYWKDYDNDKMILIIDFSSPTDNIPIVNIRNIKR